MGKIIIRIIVLLSLSLNIVLGYHVLNTPGQAELNDSLELSKEQESRLNEIHHKMNSSNEKLKHEIADCQKKLVKMLKGTQVDKVKINHCINMISSLQKKLQQNTIDEILKIKTVLNQKQCTCFMDNLDKTVKQSCKEQCRDKN